MAIRIPKDPKFVPTASPASISERPSPYRRAKSAGLAAREKRQAGAEKIGHILKSSAEHGGRMYLIAFESHDNIRAAEAYWLRSTLHYVTLQDELRLAPLDSMDPTLT